MAKWYVLVFGGLTLWASYLTFSDANIPDTIVEKHSVRQGSVHSSSRVGGFFYGGGGGSSYGRGK